MCVCVLARARVYMRAMKGKSAKHMDDDNEHHNSPRSATHIFNILEVVIN